MTCYAGFDTDQFPGLPALDWLKTHTELAWCGYYLAPAPSHADTGWMGQRAALIAQGWGLAPVYLGQQTIGPGSHDVTARQGSSDGAQAAALARAEGFPQGAVVYLDWEDGGSPPQAAIDYIRLWIAALVENGYSPGLYCSHARAVELLSRIGPGPSPRVWAWRVSTAGRHRYTGDIQHIQAADPAGCGYSQASLWQYEQDAVLSLPDTPCDGLEVDLSHSAYADPNVP
ncbi:DUF1906 domain-containing protein [Xanthomonas campestris pv. badrii]|uniref:DUF1906 domain-containing protein n=1 Tax=Xanthomonas campestris pv. badrii TaxID=149696 RepID=A0A7Z2VBD7_XANCA|nr:glycoside hydrolase domain-containing protein [Xanthomonas campestris]QJD68454.1 DUF1906 domain-containing protein [Xanthomonas campestris pv. badrii]